MCGELCHAVARLGIAFLVTADFLQLTSTLHIWPLRIAVKDGGKPGATTAAAAAEAAPATSVEMFGSCAGGRHIVVFQAFVVLELPASLFSPLRGDWCAPRTPQKLPSTRSLVRRWLCGRGPQTLLGGPIPPHRSGAHGAPCLRAIWRLGRGSGNQARCRQARIGSGDVAIGDGGGGGGGVDGGTRR